MAKFPLFNPVTKSNFYVYFVNANPRNAAEGVILAEAFLIGLGMNLIFGAFSEITGIDGDMDVVAYNEGGRNHASRQFMTRAKSPPLILKRGVTPNTDLWDWHSSFILGSLTPLRKHGVILLTDRGYSSGSNGPTATSSDAVPQGFGLPFADKPFIAAWFFLNAIPQKLAGPVMDASKNEVAIEELTLIHEGLYRLGPGLLPGGVGDGFGMLGI